MVETQEHTGNIKVEDYGLAEWMEQVEQVIKKGYRLDFKDNANYPTSFGTLYSCVLVPDTKQEPAQVQPLDTTQDEPDQQAKVDGRTKRKSTSV